MGHRFAFATICQPIHVLDKIVCCNLVGALFVVLDATEDALIDNSEIVGLILLERRLLPIELLQNGFGAENAALVKALKELRCSLCTHNAGNHFLGR